MSDDLDHARANAVWMRQLEPWRTVWLDASTRARGHGAVHGSWIFEQLADARRGYACSPADADGLIAAMVGAGDLVPIALDRAGAMLSILAFRSLGGTGPERPDKWHQHDACLWLYGPRST